MAKIFTYKGKTLEELQKMSLEEFANIANARVRRVLKRGFQPKHKKLIERSRKAKKPLKTHCRDMIILPEFIGKTFHIHNGKEYLPVTFEPEMVGHYFGEFALTRRRVQHSAPGMGATRASKYVSLK